MPSTERQSKKKETKFFSKTNYLYIFFVVVGGRYRELIER